MIRKEVGEFIVTAWDDGYPVTIEIALPRQEPLRVFGEEALTDLQYAIERVQAQLNAKRDAIRMSRLTAL